jgi:hypothetical protein
MSRLESLRTELINSLESGSSQDDAYATTSVVIELASRLAPVHFEEVEVLRTVLHDWQLRHDENGLRLGLLAAIVSLMIQRQNGYDHLVEPALLVLADVGCRLAGEWPTKLSQALEEEPEVDDRDLRLHLMLTTFILQAFALGQSGSTIVNAAEALGEGREAIREDLRAWRPVFKRHLYGHLSITKSLASVESLLS